MIYNFYPSLERQRNANLRSVGLAVLMLCLLMCMLSCKNKAFGEKNPDSTSANAFASADSLNRIVFLPQWLPQSQFAGFYVAYKKGFYAKRGLNVQIHSGGPNSPAPKSLHDNKADIVTMFLTSALKEWDQGYRIVNLAQLSQKSAFLWVAKKKHGINTINDLNNKRVGIWYSDFQEPSKIFIKKNNLSVQEIPVGWTINLFLKDGIQAMNMMLYNEYDVLINTGVSPEELTVFPMADYGVDIPEDGIYCTEEYYLKNTRRCEQFAQASLEGWQYALEHQEEALSAVLEFQKTAHLPANIPHQRWMLSKMKELVLAKPSQFGLLTRENFISSTQMMKENGFITHVPEYEEFVRNVSTQGD